MSRQPPRPPTRTNIERPPERASEDDELLKRDADRSDFIVIPLAAGVLAHLAAATNDALREPDSHLPRLAREGRAILKSVGTKFDPLWRDDARRFTRVESFVLDAWFLFPMWVPPTFRGQDLAAVSPKPAMPALDRVLAWMRVRPSAPLVDTMFVAALAAITAEHRPDECPLLARATRRLRVELGVRLRALPDPTWPGIIRAVQAEWTTACVGRLAFDLAQSSLDAMDLVVETSSALGEALTRKPARRTARAKARIPKPEQRPPAPDAHAERAAVLQRELAAARKQSAVDSERAGRWAARIEVLEAKVRDADGRAREMESELETVRREQEAIAAAFEAPADDSAPRPAIPPDALADKRILLFTGESSGDVRTELANAFYAFGAAAVTCYHADKQLGPPSVPPNAIVVIHVKFMSHSTFHTLAGVARQSRAPWYATSRGSALIGQDVAARWLADQRVSATAPAPNNPPAKSR